MTATRVGYTAVGLTRSICRESYYDFVLEFWDQVSPDPLIENWHIKVLCDELQHMAELVFKGKAKEHDLVVNIAPGTTKSIIFSIMFQPWTWTRKPNMRHLCGAHTSTLVNFLSTKARDLVQSDKYRACFGDIKIREDENTKGLWINDKGGWRLSCTAGGKTPTGFHADWITVDDPIDPEKAVQQKRREQVKRWLKGTIPSRKGNKSVTPTVLVMQRLDQDDPSAMALKTWKKVRHYNLPAELTEDVRPEYLKAKYVDGLFDPKRLGVGVLEEAKLQGTYYYASQYLQKPIPLGGQMFVTSMLRRGMPPDPILSVVRYWDKAATEGGAADTAGVKMGDTGKDFVIMHCRSGQWNTGEREEVIKQTAIDDGKGVAVGVEQEPGSGGKDSAHWTTRALAGWKTFIDHPTGNKVVRADPVSSQVNLGHVYILDGEWTESYVDQMGAFPSGQKKDKIDATSGAFKKLIELRDKRAKKERDARPLLTNMPSKTDSDDAVTVVTDDGVEVKIKF